MVRLISGTTDSTRSQLTEDDGFLLDLVDAEKSHQRDELNPPVPKNQD